MQKGPSVADFSNHSGVGGRGLRTPSPEADLESSYARETGPIPRPIAQCRGYIDCGAGELQRPRFEAQIALPVFYKAAVEQILGRHVNSVTPGARGLVIHLHDDDQNSIGRLVDLGDRVESRGFTPDQLKLHAELVVRLIAAKGFDVASIEVRGEPDFVSAVAAAIDKFLDDLPFDHPEEDRVSHDDNTFAALKWAGKEINSWLQHHGSIPDEQVPRSKDLKYDLQSILPRLVKLEKALKWGGIDFAETELSVINSAKSMHPVARDIIHRIELGVQLDKWTKLRYSTLRAIRHLEHRCPAQRFVAELETKLKSTTISKERRAELKSMLFVARLVVGGKTFDEAIAEAFFSGYGHSADD